MAQGILLLFLLLAVNLFALPIPSANFDQNIVTSYTQYKRTNDGHYRSSVVSFLHRQPIDTRIASIRYYRIVFHCHILPGSLYLRFSNRKPYRTVVQNRQDPSTIFAFRSVGAYSRVQIQSVKTGRWLCMNTNGKITQKSNITIDDLACIFRQNSDGPYMNLVSEFDPSYQMNYNTLHLLLMNPILSRSYAPYLTNANELFQNEQCNRFMLDNQIDESLINRLI